ncbi:MAG: hypothetical protein QNK40_11515 [Desulfobacterales bacterium]|nr:hypothetical protein [Desulfobacterales bacterium]
MASERGPGDGFDTGVQQEIADNANQEYIDIPSDVDEALAQAKKQDASN